MSFIHTFQWLLAEFYFENNFHTNFPHSKVLKSENKFCPLFMWILHNLFTKFQFRKNRFL